MSKNWNQPLCWTCWFAFSLAQSRVVYEPTRLRSEEWHHVDCCVCRAATAEGIFVRLDPEHVPYTLATTAKEEWVASARGRDGDKQ